VVGGLVSDSLLILAPLLVLAVVLLLGFAGCGFESGTSPPDPTPTLTFRATVPAALRVLDPGVKFTWTRPAGTMEQMPVKSPTSGPSVDAYVDAALNLDPSLFWTLGSGIGLHDLSENGRHGTPLGGVTVGGVPDGPTDFFDGIATLFDGMNDGLGSSYNPFVGTTARTFVGWALWDSGGPAEYTLFGSSAGETDRPTLRVVVSNRNVKWLPSGSDGQQIIWTAAAPPEDTWFMWALRADPGNDQATLYIDGQKVSDQAMTDEWPAAPGNFQAGIGATNQQPFKGAQGFVGVYEKSLSDAEIAALYQASKGGGGDAVYEHPIPSPEAGIWSGRCEMTVRADSQTAPGASGDYQFTLPAVTQHYVLSFEAEGSPLTPHDPFRVRAVGLS
jgi:Concanavalin A-like lectin/glucanases superfamily